MSQRILIFILCLITFSTLIAQDEVNFYATQFNTLDEAQAFRDILAPAGYDFSPSGTEALIDRVLAGDESIDLIGILHGDLVQLYASDTLLDLTELRQQLQTDRDFSPRFLALGQTPDSQAQVYIPWTQATFIMAANTASLEYLPQGTDIDTLTWQNLQAWCRNIFEVTGSPRCALPYAGLFHRFLQGYLYPSFTGGMVTEFRSDSAVEMFEFVRDDLWEVMHPQSLNITSMQDALLAGDVWIGFDHTARLLDVFLTAPEQYIAFPAPTGPAGRSYLSVIAGLSIPQNATNITQANDLIDYLTQPDTQLQYMLNGFFPVVSSVDTSMLPRGLALISGAVETQATDEDSFLCPDADWVRQSRWRLQSDLSAIPLTASYWMAKIFKSS